MVQSPDLKRWLPIAANFSWQSFVIIQIIGWVSPRLPGSTQLNSIFGFAIGCLICMLGITCGVWTTVEVRRGADRALLKPALVGLVLNGLLLACGIGIVWAFRG
jgi:hypothetical protein